MRYIVFVLISPDVSDIDESVERAMAPFDSSSELQEEEQVCRCVGRQAREDAQEYAGRVYKDECKRRGEPDVPNEASDRRQIELSNKWKLSKAEERELDGLMAEFDWKFAEDEELFNRPYYNAFSGHPLLHEPDANCEVCGGSGKHVGQKTARVAFWKIGWGSIYARVNYSFLEKHEPEWKSRRFRDKCARIQTQERTDNFQRDIIAVHHIPENWPIPRAVIVDGLWYESEEAPLSLPMRENALAKKEWERTYHQLLEEHPDSLAVVCMFDSESNL